MNRKLVIDALLAADIALTYWARSLKESSGPVYTTDSILAYIADTRMMVKATLKEMRKRK